jgi:hypothetical protein
MRTPNRKTKTVTGADPLKAVVVMGLLGVTLLICGLAPPVQVAGETGVVMELPEQVGDLQAFPEDVTKTELEILPSDTTFARKTYGLPGASTGRSGACLRKVGESTTARS